MTPQIPPARLAAFDAIFMVAAYGTCDFVIGE